ncbi:CAAX prenyl protease 2 [Biomphalaria glabrata]|uniref:CAAX prenyl protease 2 n=1 Tax=Biomphalaria glabrata TaxID=6526 RepID=A0A2C9JES7_BIOGL|nr:CAAX prenyl protease 2-like [Biomphalaria glabrata]KAI8744639.1 CAAX prenyl protease 2 [Biomphalaria glabrata]KAI8747565.1 CAAX prenyl protease 2-like [Biomphalaria glabrata]
MVDIVFVLPTWQAILLCFLFAVLYVGSLYIWGGSTKEKNRDHPDVIKRRFISVLIVCTVTPLILLLVSKASDTAEANHLLTWLGIRFWGLLPALVVPLFLTMVLFLGPLSLHYLDGVFRIYLEAKYWTNSVKNYVWIRNHIVAPLSEEFIFRACMLPLLVPCLGSGWSILLCPLFFGVAHFHHMIEKVAHGQQEVAAAFKESLFQLSYTTIFGAYSAFLYLRTGHLAAPVIAHAFCNHMGFPSFGEVMGYPASTRYRLIAMFVLGLVLWTVLLYPLTSPALYSNEAFQA